MSDHRLSDREMGENEDPGTMGGAIGSATGAGAAAGLGFSVLGPLGAVLGALAGTVGGWWAGREIVEAVEDVDRADVEFRRAHEHAGATRPYEEARHGYQLGYLAGRNPQYADTSFLEIEDTLRGAWVESHIHDRDPVPWEQVRSDAKTGFELARKVD